jgi:hypothetical protein
MKPRTENMQTVITNHSKLVMPMGSLQRGGVGEGKGRQRRVGEGKEGGRGGMGGEKKEGMGRRRGEGK